MAWEWTTWNILYVCILLAIYFVCNIVGTVFFSKLRRLSDVKPIERETGVLALVIGWLLFPFVNLTANVTMYRVHIAK